MTPFTDDDLKRLKEHLVDKNRMWRDLDHWKVPELLSRLEAAERALTMFLERKIKLPKENYWCIEAWRQSAGKDGL